MSSRKRTAMSLYAIDQRTMSSTADSTSDEIEIPLELVGRDERLPRGLDDERQRPRRQGAGSPASEGHLSPLHEEELTGTSSSSSSSSSQSTSPDQDEEWTACCSNRTLVDGEVAVSDSAATVDARQDPYVEVVSGSTNVSSSATAECRCNRSLHHSSPGITARLGSLLNSAVMKAQKQLSRGQHNNNNNTTKK